MIAPFIRRALLRIRIAFQNSRIALARVEENLAAERLQEDLCAAEDSAEILRRATERRERMEDDRFRMIGSSHLTIVRRASV